MIRGTQGRLHTSPLFYDTLSGEFTTLDDRQRTHTLGRLACASFDKGTRSINRESDLPHLEARYTPSWASHIAVTTSVEFVDENGLLPPTLMAIYLQDAADNSLFIMQNDRTVRLDVLDEVEDLSLSLGDELDLARAAITSATQRFFDQATRT